jgi:hypothetical protein
MKLSTEQINGFNRWMAATVRANKVLTKASGSYIGLIVLVDNKITVNLKHLSPEYQEKFILMNYDDFCSNFITFLKKAIVSFFILEKIEYHTFNFVFILDGRKFEKFVTIFTPS